LGKTGYYSFSRTIHRISSRYRYIIFNHPIRPAILSSRTSWYYYPLDVVRMRAAGKYLLDEQDFSSFRSSQCNSKTPMRCVTDFEIARQGNLIILEIEANAFLPPYGNATWRVCAENGIRQKDRFYF